MGSGRLGQPSMSAAILCRTASGDVLPGETAGGDADGGVDHFAADRAREVEEVGGSVSR